MVCTACPAQRRAVESNVFILAEQALKHRELGCPEASMMELHATCLKGNEESKEAGNFFGETTQHNLCIYDGPLL